MLLLLAFLPLELALLWYTLKRSGFVPFPHLQLIYMIGGQICIYLVSYNIVKYNFLRTYSTYAFKEHYAASQLLLAVVFFSTFFLFLPAPNIRFADGLRRTLQFSPSSIVVLALVLLLWMYHVLIAIVLNWKYVWVNHTYLLMNDHRVLSIDNSFTSFLLSVFPLAGFIVFVFFSVYMTGKQSFIAASLFPLALFDYLYQAGAHSRKAVMYLLVFGIISLLLKRSKALVGFAFAASIFTLAFCLGGRSYGEQGFSTFADTPEILETYAKLNPADGFLNIFEGAFVTTEMFNRHPGSSMAYEVLSFSPFPSLIDGFSTIRQANLHKLGRYSPPSAILEAWAFGLPFILLLILPQIIGGRLAVGLIARGNSSMAVAINLLMTYASYAQFTYPVRTVYRFFLIALVLAVFTAIATRMQRHERARLNRPWDARQNAAFEAAQDAAAPAA
jgi:hypothetical protein